MRVIVTRKDNVVMTEEGEVYINEDGEIELKNPETVGRADKTHVLALQQFNSQEQRLETGFITKTEVFWEDQRTPAPSLEDPAELIWLSIMSDADSNSQEESDEHDEHDELDEEAEDEERLFS